MKALDKLHSISKILTPSGIEAPEKEAELLLQNTLSIDLVRIYSENQEISEEQIKFLGETIRRRTSREPLQYIFGHIDFLGLNLQVGKGVLIPRPETELMAELAVKTVTDCRLQAVSENKNLSPVTCHSSLNILDLCTGSGCIALALAKEFPEAQVYGIDISDIALSYAKKNAGLNNVGNGTFLAGNLFEPLNSSLHHYSHFFDFIISNPPYIRTDDIETLQPEVRDWEPLNALDGGADGLDYYKEIIPAARQFLKHDGILMLELGEGQSNAVSQIVEDTGYRNIEIVKDYAGIERIIHAQWTK